MTEVDAFAISAQFQELQKEKKRLQNKLDHMRFRRKDLESKQSSVADKNRLLLQKYESMSRTVHIAKMKIQDSQMKVDKLQKVNDELQVTVGLTRQSMKKEDENKDGQLIAIQTRYDELADDFRGAKKYYEENSLENEIKNLKITCQGRTLNIESGKEIITSISSHLEKLSLIKEEIVSDEKPQKNGWTDVCEKKQFLHMILQEEANMLGRSIDQETYRLHQIHEKISCVQSEVNHKRKELAKLKSA